jgi:hypothetical protein
VGGLEVWRFGGVEMEEKKGDGGVETGDQSQPAGKKRESNVSGEDPHFFRGRVGHFGVILAPLALWCLQRPTWLPWTRPLL